MPRMTGPLRPRRVLAVTLDVRVFLRSGTLPDAHAHAHGPAPVGG